MTDISEEQLDEWEDGPMTEERAMEILSAADPGLVRELILQGDTMDVLLALLKKRALQTEDEQLRLESRQIIKERGLELLLIAEEDPESAG